MRQLRKVLVANRGEIARRVIRAARGLGIATAVVYSDADADALFVAEADEAVRLPGTAATDTYLAIDLVVEAAVRVGADAVHPGYGFLSENAGFAQAVLDAGLVFVGPPPAAIRSMGDKVEAKTLMAAAGVPVLGGVTVGGEGGDSEGGTDLGQALAEIGTPAIIKASAGGGGRGMRIVESADEVVAAVESAQREARAAFGDGTVFIERYISPARHIEVQVVADDHGQAATLFERECSIQRRHQKVVEEAPSPVVTPEIRARLLDAAEKAVRAVDYRGLGTVEFVLAADGSFAFLEMNTRLQVEHPVTEFVTGLDLVQLQLRVAAGEPLGPEVLEAGLSGHAIEVRLCAEDPAAGYLPVSGTFDAFEITGDGIRVDTGVAAGSTVPPYYDSMVAKVIAYGPTRRIAAAKLADALERARLTGLATNRDLLVRILRTEEFLTGDTTTDFLTRVPGLTEPRTTPETQRLHAAVAALALSERESGERPVQQSVPFGWRNNRASLTEVGLATDDGPVTVLHDLAAEPPALQVDGDPVEVTVHGLTGELVDATLAGVRRRYRVHTSGDVVTVDSPLGSSAYKVADRLPVPRLAGPVGGLTAPMPGSVVRLLVAVGDRVEAGTPLLVLEAMKMEHAISSPTDGVVTALNVTEGLQVERGEVLAAVVAEEELPE